MKTPEQIIRGVVTTEKTTELKGRQQYVFEVAPDANKIEIRRAVEQLFRVHVVSVRTMWRGGKWRWGRTMRPGRTPDRKRAIVTLRENETIEIT